MSHPIVIPWLPRTGNLAAIASNQNTGADAVWNLILNSNTPDLPQGPYMYDRVVRKVSLTSGNNFSGGTFTITGIGSPVDGNGNPTQVLGPISEVLVGPNANTVQSANIYSQVNSITVAGVPNRNGISAGFGTSGITDYVFLDYNRAFFQTSLQVTFANYAATSVQVYQSLTKPQIPNPNGNLTANTVFNPFVCPAPFNVPIVAAAGAIGYLPSPASLVWATVSLTGADSTYFTVLQQGIR